jgi:hypothetical protein
MARPTGRWSWRSQRGAVLVHVAIAIIGLTAFAALAIDYGILWMSRRQAQNAADSAALSGATSLAFDDPSDLDLARGAAEAAGESHSIFGQAPNIDPGSGSTDADIIIGPCPPNSPGLPDTCVRANVYRNQQKDPLPTFFARLLGLTEQGVKATATAQVVTGTLVRCVRPWAVPDRWNDVVDNTVEETGCLTGYPDATNWCWNDEYEGYDKKGVPLDPRDTYDEDADGFDYDLYRGQLVRLKPGNPNQAITAGWFFPIDLPMAGGPESGGDRYRENIGRCNSLGVQAGDTLWSEPGNMIGPTNQGMADLIAQDPGASFNSTTGEIEDSCAGEANACFCPNAEGDLESCTLPISPRLVPIPVFDVDQYSLQDKSSGKFPLRITRILGFFVNGMDGNDVTGHLYPYPSEPGTGGSLNNQSSFLRSVILIR